MNTVPVAFFEEIFLTSFTEVQFHARATRLAGSFESWKKARKFFKNGASRLARLKQGKIDEILYRDKKDNVMDEKDVCPKYLHSTEVVLSECYNYEPSEKSTLMNSWTCAQKCYLLF
ncbi:hypothetical protein L596_017671 [Steinernema carpocapsae]|uniref:Uncharacterized protein n=1 Tax=Steinernema carpocapsae TaxID=34508 RepID=A0A4U5N2Q5_STECR|nr:hypothetical protein L596_017671 [Steinernema carpocapsae]